MSIEELEDQLEVLALSLTERIDQLEVRDPGIEISHLKDTINSLERRIEDLERRVES